MATFVGAGMGGFWGAVCATVGVVLPSFVVILLVAGCYDAFRKSKVVKGIMSGLKPAVVGLIAGAVVTVAAAVFVPAEGTSGWLWGIVVAGMLALSLKFKKMHPIVIICICAVIGLLAGYMGIG